MNPNLSAEDPHIVIEREAVLSFGANLGDREQAIHRAMLLIERMDGIRVRAKSSLWESPAWKPDGGEDSPDYLNSIVIVGTTLNPDELLEAVNALEDAFGRVRNERYGDRTLDVDIVTYEGVEIETPRLTLPHPLAHTRQFVLQPWIEVQPDAVLPGHGSIRELADYVDGDAWRLGE